MTHRKFWLALVLAATVAGGLIPTASHAGRLNDMLLTKSGDCPDCYKDRSDDIKRY